MWVQSVVEWVVSWAAAPAMTVYGYVFGATTAVASTTTLAAARAVDKED